MTELFLTRLLLQEFRTFSRCEIELPNRPGVLLVSGTNGLGKSTLFDGLEWCLTGKIDRFGTAAKGVDGGDYLRRFGTKSVAPTCVEAAFGEDLTGRTLIGANTQPTGVDPIELLKAADWRGDIGELHNYLLLTHFLGQSTLTRMTHREADDRWEYLQGPARSDWATKIGETFHGHGNSAEARAYEKAIDAVNKEIARLQDLLNSEQAQYEGGRAAGALSSAQVASEGAAILDLLGSAEANAPAPGSDAQEWLDRIAAAVVHLQGELARHDARAARIDELVARFQEARARASQAQKNVSDAAVRSAELRARAAAGEASLVERREARDGWLAELARVGGQREAWERLRGLLETRLRALTGLRTLDAELPELQVAFDQSEAQLARAQHRLRLANLADGRRVSAQRLVAAAASELRRAQDVVDLDQRITAAQAALDALLQPMPDAQARLVEARGRRDTAAAQVQTATQALTQAQSAVTALSSAVVSVAAHIGEATCDCPVCATTFAPGELRRRAEAAAARLGPTLAPLQLLASMAQTDLIVLEAELAGLVDLNDRITVARQALAGLQAERMSKVAEVDVGDAGFDPTQVVVAAAQRLADLHRQADRQSRWLAVLGEPATLQAAWQTDLLGRNAAERRLTERREARQQAARLLERSDQDLQMGAVEAGVTPPVTSEAVDTGLAAARETEAKVKLEVAGAETALTSVQETLIQIQAELSLALSQESELSASQDAASKALGDAGQAWLDAGFGGDTPSVAARVESDRMLQALHTRLATGEQRLAMLRDGYSAGLQQAAHREALNQLRRAVQAPLDATREVVRQAATAELEAAARKAQAIGRAQGVAQSAYQEIVKQVDTFNQTYLAPLNKLMTQINRAILTDPDVGLELKATKRKVHQRTQRHPKAPASIDKLNPLLVHSEGQMAALAVSMLCAASVTFGWSRWRALVMDDPLQHNDVVHASAFADLMRTLVLERRYQIFLSTHDAGQAAFLRRKFIAGGVPCTTVHLVGRSEQGTIFEVEGSSAAAA